MSPRYQIIDVEPADLEVGDRIHTRLNVPGSTHVTEYVVTKNIPAENVVHAVDAYRTDGPTTHLKYTDWLFSRAEV